MLFQALQRASSNFYMPSAKRSTTSSKRIFQFPTSMVCSLLLVALFVTATQAQQMADEDRFLDLPVVHPSLDIGSAGNKQLALLHGAPPIVPPTLPPPTPQTVPVDDPKDVPPPVLFGEEIAVEHDTLYYVIDISGSMSWDNLTFLGLDGQHRTGNRMDRAKVEITRSILGLSSNFRFNIIAYSCVMYPWRNGLQPADDMTKQAAIGWVNMLIPQDATGTGPAVVLALGDRQNQSIALITDGAPNCGVPAFASFAVTGYYDELAAQNQHRELIRSKNNHGARINVFGIASSGSYRSFCQGVAADSGGSYTDVH